ncbi:MAG: glutamate--tRNA ligase [Gemmatimonadota bacterium]
MTLRVRFAPSPTGFLHVGGARTALFNWLLARKEGGVFVLRIEDTDRARSRDEMTQAILDGLAWLGLDWDEGPHFQGAQVQMHRAAALRLLEEGKAYRDFSSQDELRGEAAALGIGHPSQLARRRADELGPAGAAARAAAGDPYAIRLRVEPGETVWQDLIHGQMRVGHDDVDDLIILRSDGSPTYNLAVVCDDASMEISHVIRGDDHISNTPKQILLHEALGYPVPRFGHVPLILGTDGKRLSKRHGATALGDYARQGILPEAMVNFLALLGWNPGDEREVLNLEALTEAFSLERVGRKSAVFDLDKLAWLNGQHLSLLPVERVEPVLTPLLEERLGEDEVRKIAFRSLCQDGTRYRDLLLLLKERARGLDQVADDVIPYLDLPLERDPEAMAKHWKDPVDTRERLQALERWLVTAESWELESLETGLRSLAEELGVGAGKLIHPLRVAVLGRAVSPGIFHVLQLLGRTQTLRRLHEALEHPFLQSA